MPDDQGAAVVEFAIVVIPLLTILFGIAQFGFIYAQQLSMQYAAREAARTIALKYDDPTMTSPLLDSLVDEQLVELLPGVDDVADLAQYAVSIDGCSVDAPLDDTAVVHLTRDVTLAVPLIDTSALETVTAKAEMPCEG